MVIYKKKLKKAKQIIKVITLYFYYYNSMKDRKFTFNNKQITPPYTP